MKFVGLREERLWMVQKSGVHQLRLVVYPIIWQGFSNIPGGCLGFLNQQYGPKIWVGFLDVFFFCDFLRIVPWDLSPHFWSFSQTSNMQIQVCVGCCRGWHERMGGELLWCLRRKKTRLVVSNMFNVHPNLGKIPVLTSIFFRWVGSTTNPVVDWKLTERNQQNTGCENEYCSSQAGSLWKRTGRQEAARTKGQIRKGGEVEVVARSGRWWYLGHGFCRHRSYFQGWKGTTRHAQKNTPRKVTWEMMVTWIPYPFFFMC